MLLAETPSAVASLRRNVERLRHEVDLLDLTRRQRYEVASALAAAGDELLADEPDLRRVAGQLARFVTVLRTGGIPVSARPALAHALGRLRAGLRPLPF